MAISHDKMGRDACAGCGESTAVGTVLFSDRRTLPDGTRLCAICNSLAAAHHRRQRLTNEEVRQLINNGTMAAIVWANGGRTCEHYSAGGRLPARRKAATAATVMATSRTPQRTIGL